MSGRADTVTVRVSIARPAPAVLAAFTDPRRLPDWARAASARPAADGWWILDTPSGEARIRFHADPARGIADHEYADRERVWRVPARVVPEGQEGAGALLTLELRRPPGMRANDFARLVAGVERELAAFKALVEASG